MVLAVNLSGQVNAIPISNAGLEDVNIGADSAFNGIQQISIGSVDAGELGNQVVTIDGQQIDLNQGVTLNIDASSSNTASTMGRTTITRADVENILSKYSVDRTVEQPSEITSYPTPVILTGQLPTTSVTQAQVLSIATTQADMTNGAVGQTTEYDRNITYLFNKQTQVSQTIANLLNIIRKGTANRDKAEADITLYKSKYEEAVHVHEQLSITIAQKEAKVKGIKGGITETQKEIDLLKGELSAVDSQISVTKANGLKLTHELSVALANKDGLNTQMTSTQSTIKSLTARLDSQSANCDKSNAIVVGLQANISTLQASIAGIDTLVAGIDGDIDEYQAQIAALQAQIRIINGKIDNAKAEKTRLINLNYTVPQQIASLKAQIAIQNAQCGNDNNVFIELTAARERLSQLQVKLTDNGNNIAKINGSISLVKGELTELIATHDKLTAGIAEVTANMRTLKLSLPKYESELSECYIRGNKALKFIQSANSSLSAATARFRIESDALTVANYHLQIARTEQQEISIQINLLLQ